MQFLEAFLALLPTEAGGRVGAVEPREGSYRPFLRMGESVLRVRVIEGPPLIAPGEHAPVVMEIEEGTVELAPGSEMELLENDRLVGLVTVSRLWPGALAV
jgi:hypothetical protein